jgi:outer membrane protein assembly factor BamE (lipoprotein component of BamABCDE complex)
MKTNAHSREVVSGGLRSDGSYALKVRSPFPINPQESDGGTNTPVRTTASRFTAGTAVRLASLAAVLTLMSGCVGVLPLPVTSSQPEHGCKIDRAQVAFIHPGRTTRAQVIERLGPIYSALPLNRAFAYTWELPGGGGVWWYCIALGEAAAAGGDSWAGGWRGFFVAFDDQGVVTATAFKKLSCRRPLHENMDRWVAKLPPSASPVKAIRAGVNR